MRKYLYFIRLIIVGYLSHKIERGYVFPSKTAKKGDIRIGMRTQNQPRSNWICGIEVEILKEADLAGISNMSCSPVMAGGNKVRPSVH